ncbi:tetratricopeptide repeat protein [Pseudomonas sp. TCU-HL1]|uniref:tetratricopeptide repeat protein n=1 Tax=Pseudomonas sp. TCU-HL1 TaxID=1856685 RepID=UPI00083E3983|nr:hypothetical protein [Pseudomonas sp. TCU-HL1]AOE83566.1 hypothetical protein THL1_1018 [Pseudomonas sp. TCU-HL1]
MSSKGIWWAACLFWVLVLSILSFSFIHNPLVFDDVYFFLNAKPGVLLHGGLLPIPRDMIYLSFTWWGDGQLDIPVMRIVNLGLHLGVVLSVFALVRQLLGDLGVVQCRKKQMWAAFASASLFAVHPFSALAYGYLVQRTILCATLFSILSLLAFWRGLAGNRFELWGSAAFFAMAVLSKEHAVMIPALSFLMLCLYLRSGKALGVSSRQVFLVLATQGLISLYAVVVVRRVLGASIEIMTDEVLGGADVLPEYLYPLSVLNQTSLFFKYVFLWLFPNPLWVSMDMRETFPLVFSSWSLWVGAFFYLFYIAAGIFLLWRGGKVGLVGFAMLMPALLFFTEFSSVRLQETFVVYRSYLWCSFLFVLVGIFLSGLKARWFVFAFSLSFFVFSLLSYDRLFTFSNPYFVWREAADLYERSPVEGGEIRFGGYRIYYNVGTSLYSHGFSVSALDGFNKSIELMPNYGYAYNNRGAALLSLNELNGARADFEMAISLVPKNSNSYIGLAQALRGLGENAAAEDVLGKGCRMGLQKVCSKQALSLAQ